MANKYKYVPSSLVIWKILTKAQMEKKMSNNSKYLQSGR